MTAAMLQRATALHLHHYVGLILLAAVEPTKLSPLHQPVGQFHTTAQDAVTGGIQALLTQAKVQP
jgi:hypothetical protein